MTKLIKGALIAGLFTVPMAGACISSGISMLEKYKEKVICTDTCAETPSGSFKGYAVVSLTDEFMSAIDTGSTISLRVGDWEFEKKLGDDPNYSKGRTSAILQDAVVTSSGTVIIVKVKLNWSFGVLFVKFKGLTPFQASPVAASLVGTSVGSKSVDVVAEVFLRNGDDYRGFATHGLEMNGGLTRKTKEVNGVLYDLDKITLLGAF
jgi:hypothetical protein